MAKQTPTTKSKRSIRIIDLKAARKNKRMLKQKIKDNKNAAFALATEKDLADEIEAENKQKSVNKVSTTKVNKQGSKFMDILPATKKPKSEPQIILSHKKFMQKSSVKPVPLTISDLNSSDEDPNHSEPEEALPRVKIGQKPEQEQEKAKTGRNYFDEILDKVDPKREKEALKHDLEDLSHEGSLIDVDEYADSNEKSMGPIDIGYDKELPDDYKLDISRRSGAKTYFIEFIGILFLIVVLVAILIDADIIDIGFDLPFDLL